MMLLAHHHHESVDARATSGRRIEGSVPTIIVMRTDIRGELKY